MTVWDQYEQVVPVRVDKNNNIFTYVQNVVLQNLLARGALEKINKQKFDWGNYSLGKSYTLIFSDSFSNVFYFFFFIGAT